MKGKQSNTTTPTAIVTGADNDDGEKKQKATKRSSRIREGRRSSTSTSKGAENDDEENQKATKRSSRIREGRRRTSRELEDSGEEPSLAPPLAPRPSARQSIHMNDYDSTYEEEEDDDDGNTSNIGAAIQRKIADLEDAHERPGAVCVGCAVRQDHGDHHSVASYTITQQLPPAGEEPRDIQDDVSTVHVQTAMLAPDEDQLIRDAIARREGRLVQLIQEEIARQHLLDSSHRSRQEEVVVHGVRVVVEEGGGDDVNVDKGSAGRKKKKGDKREQAPEVLFCGMSTRMLLIAGIIGAIFGIIAIVVGVVIVVSSTPSPGGNETASISDAPVDKSALVPTASPTNSSAEDSSPAPPTTTDSTDQEEEVTTPFSPRFESLLQIIGASISDDPLLVFRDTTTDQHSALAWMANVDELDLDIESVDPQILIERYALALLWMSTSNWIQDGNFLHPTKSICQWNNDEDATSGYYTEDFRFTGVICSNDGFAIELVLGGNEIAGTIPSEIALLTNIRHIDFDHNNIQGTLPSQMYHQLTNLEILWFTSNLLTGTLSTKISELTSMVYLDFSSNKLEGTLPTELGRLTNMQHLALTYQYSLDGWTGSLPSELGQMTYLRSLAASVNGLEGTIPTELGQLSWLEYLYLDQNRLEGPIPSELGSMTEMMYLVLFGNALEGTVPTELEAMTLLEEISLENNILTGSLDHIFCQAGTTTKFSNDSFWADCSGDDPEITCSCCTNCCDRKGQCASTSTSSVSFFLRGQSPTDTP